MPLSCNNSRGCKSAQHTRRDLSSPILDATGEGLAVDRQREDCRRIVDQRGWQLVGEYVGNSISASDSRKARPGYNALVESYKAGGFDALVCWDLDRLTRQPANSRIGSTPPLIMG